ncbi:ABC transporter ATP-binding protein [Leptolyngbya sp. FACHB-36]|uniref:ABC transporter ATP-binding protein n=1 Tax=Leptolyngbya sp. FACHB-36 TaxID=2692808 RepID=UPI001680BA11|nr:ABC transporter ATP-binding protein [Leptolyngbya sp. FACHB-36]MBD2018997.1 ABC transporter ATP-binding protein [Leptolyngbya sp. FACHB-36]
MLRIEHVSKQFNNGFLALDGIHLQVNPGEIVSFVGTSGCGKSTLLRIISGLESPTSGQVLIDDELIRSPHPNIGIIFQEPRLMPWLTVQQNVQFGLEAWLPKPTCSSLVQRMLDRVGLTEFAQALPRQLSGGMAQRVAIARALVTKPSILLLDEPFSALDAFIRMKLQDHLLHIWTDDRPTLLLVTHDVEEALVLSDRVIVLRGSPGRVYREFVLDLPRPRKRTDLQVQRWKEQLLSALDLSSDQSELPAEHAIAELH